MMFSRIKTLLFNTSRWKQLMVVMLSFSVLLFPIHAYAFAWIPILAIGLGAILYDTTVVVTDSGLPTVTGALLNSLGAIGVDLVNRIISWLATFVIGVLLVWVTSFLTFAIDPGIGRISDFPIVEAAVPITQGIANLLLVAILIIIAIATILGIESYGLRKLLPMLIFIALIVNFSTVLAGLIIDAGQTLLNFLNNLFIQAIPGNSSDKLGDYLWRQMAFSRELVLDPDTVLGPLAEGRGVFERGNFNETVMRTLSLTILIAVGAIAVYIFFRLSIYLLMRLPVFWLLIILAPLAFILAIIPVGRSYLKTWWQQLFYWSFLGGITLFIFYLGAFIWGLLNQPAVFLQTFTRFQNAGITGSVSLLVTFPIVAFFFIYALNISKKMAGAAANAVVDSVIGLSKAVTLGGAALGAGAALAGVGGALLRKPFVKRTYERLQQSPSRALQATGRRLEVAHRAAVEEEQKRAKGVYAGIDALSSPDIERRLPSMDARQKVTSAGIFQERKERGLSREFAQEALTLSTSIDKEVERRLKRSAPHARYYSTEPQHVKTGNIRVADAYNYMVTNNIRGIELAPEALETPAIAGLLDYRQLTEIARRGTPQQLQSMIKGIEELTKSENIPMQLAIAAEIRKDPGAYQKALEGFMQRIQTEEIFKAGRVGEYVKPLDLGERGEGGGGGTTTT